ncbi:unnamed protein product [Mesocestoides corti]|uniref:Protein SERAC1 n=1 Tax=Mesocestoides corti TaxID=53468 RepID=A0A0R3UF61_MESCO|nr:unnamed protein product [Mesocestoides corti]
MFAAPMVPPSCFETAGKQQIDDPNSPPPEIDIIFVNGMLGSVFHTWRQRDISKTEDNENFPGCGDNSSFSNLKSDSCCPGQIGCWPQTWLSKEFPEARILGVNANLRPFIWNPICPAEKIKRRIDQRAHDILQQLLMAGVGRRPIVWVSHSAGGILTKEVLRLSASWLDESSALCSSSKKSGSNSHFYNDTQSASAFSSSSVATEISSPGSFNSVESGEINLAEVMGSHVADMEPPSSVARQTKGIIFLSVPHRGNQSMMFLYQFPMIFTLTPEAKQLQQNNESIMNLHDWFLTWISTHPVEVLNMIEDRKTVVNRWYSVRFVQNDPQDTDFSEVVLVDTDHSDICKPKDRQDEVYTRIVAFISRVLDSSS